MKNRSLLARKMTLFYIDIKSKRSGKMRLQKDQEFQQTNIKKLNKEYDVDMYSTKLRGGKAFAAEQKIRELKRLLLKSKRMKKFEHKRAKPNELIKKATFNLNNIKSPKYGFAPQEIENKVFKKYMIFIGFRELKRLIYEQKNTLQILTQEKNEHEEILLK